MAPLESVVLLIGMGGVTVHKLAFCSTPHIYMRALRFAYCMLAKHPHIWPRKAVAYRHIGSHVASATETVGQHSRSSSVKLTMA